MQGPEGLDFLYVYSFILLYYYDQSFTILEIFHAEMAENFSFDLRRIKKKYFFFGCDNDVNDWS